MKHTLPVILGAGIFDSKNRFKGIDITEERNVTTYELEFFFEDGGISVINGKDCPIKKGNVLFSKPDDIRYSHLPFTCYYLHFTLNDKALINAVENIPSFFKPSDQDGTEEKLNSIINNFYSANQLDNITSCAELITLLHSFINEKTEKLSIISTAQAYIKKNYEQNISVDEIANACNVSTSYLHKIFKNKLGITPSIYLLNHRISVAQNLLVNSNQTLTEIAFNCGFNSGSYFSDCFKKNVGVTPKDFRKNKVYTL